MSSTNKTSTLQLNQWVGTDPVLMEDFNADNQKLDAAVKALQAGALHIMTGTYGGSGTYGSGNKNSLSFSFTPKLLIIGQLTSENGHGGFPWLRGMTRCRSRELAQSSDFCTVEWVGTTVRWYAETASAQLNSSGRSYHFLALG